MTGVDLISYLLLASGTGFCLIGALGLVRFPDYFSRIHAAGVIDTIGTVGIALGLMLQAGLSEATIKLALILVFILITGPTATHALSRAALHDGFYPETDPDLKQKDE